MSGSGMLSWIRGRVIHRFGGAISRAIYGGEGTDIPAEDWDNLIVLDACRADLFESVADIDQFDEYESVTSVASATREWLQKTWAGGSWGDVVYVSAHPFVSQEAGGCFHHLEQVWVDGGDPETGTVLPETVRERAKQSFHDDKRLVVHFIQPHHPFYRTSVTASKDDWANRHSEPSGEAAGNLHDPWDELRKGTYTREEVWEAYADTLEAALPDALDLAEWLPGRTVITSDHGNMLYRRPWPFPVRISGHPGQQRWRELTEVPWAVIDGEERRDVTGERTEQVEYDNDVLKEQLADLGYTEV